MSRLDDAFKHKPIFMPYFPVGYPDLATSIDVIEALAKNGADLIEVGMSFSDPLADGPVIQKATQVALEQGVGTRQVLEAVAELRKRGVKIPLVLMGYFNPMLAYGLQRFVEAARTAGVDGFIVPDLPPEESQEFDALLAANGDRPLPLIRMLAPTSSPERMERVARQAAGFVYLVSVTGVTGARADVPQELAALIGNVRRHTSAPVCVGFGIGTPEQARAVGAIADGIIVGSACVRTVGESSKPVEAARTFANSFSDALKV